MNDIVDLLPVPTERDMPPGRFEQRRDLLVQFVAADLAGSNPVRVSRFAVLRSWLMALGLFVIVVALAGSVLLSAHGRLSTTRAAVEAAAFGSVPLVLAVTALPRSQAVGAFGRLRTGVERPGRDGAASVGWAALT